MISGDATAPDAAVVLALAQAVVARGEDRVQHLTEDNAGSEWTSLSEAVASGRPFTLRYRVDLLVADGDSDDADIQAETFAGELREAGHMPVSWASGRPRHRQLVVHLPDRARRDLWERRAKALGLDVRVYSRPPLSPHRLGLPVKLIAPDTVEEALLALAGPDALPNDRLTARTWHRLRFGDPDAPSGSEVVFRIAMGMMARHWQKDRAFRVLMWPKNEGGDALRRRHQRGGEQAARRWFDLVWLRAEEFLADNPPITPMDATKVRLALHQLLEEADKYIWPMTVVGTRADGDLIRVRGTSTRRCLEAVIAIGLKAATTVPYCSQRHLLDVSGLGSVVTLRKALVALEHLGWLRRLSRGKGTRASIFEIRTEGPRQSDPQDHL